MKKTSDPDPEIPFHVSDSNRIAQNVAMTRALMTLNSAETALLIFVLTVLLMRGGG